MSLHISGYRTPATDASPDAPNAANAAPLMPECYHCGGKGERAKPGTGYLRPIGNHTFKADHEKVWSVEGADWEPCPMCDGTGRERGSREGFPAIIRPGHLGADEQLPAYAWPGGYPLAYLPGTVYPGDPELIDTHSVILCADCATQSLHNPDEWSDEEAMTSVLEDGDLEQHTVCDGCNAVIAYQNWCEDCRESVECDEEHPFHLCPATEPYTVRYLATVPGTEWITYDNCAPIEGPVEARSIALQFKNSGTAAFVHYQPSRLDFPPVIDEEKED